MKLPALLAAVSLASLALAVTPLAAADHCDQYPVGNELKCKAYETADDVLRPVNCMYNTPPAAWFTVCIPLTGAALP